MSSTPGASAQLQVVNIANMVAYCVNVLVTYGVGASGKFPTNAELSAKYQTIVTPAGFAFAIWGIIFIAQLIWAFFQLLPAYRNSTLVVKGVGYNYVAVCLAQVLWTIFFSAEQIVLSLVAMLSILVPLVFILNRTSNDRAQSTSLYWLLKFPFEIHAAWIMAASLVNFNVVFVALNLAPDIQLMIGWASLIILVCAAIYYTYNERWVVPCVLAWASYAIKAELSNPKDSILDRFSTESIASIKTAAGSLAVAVLVLVFSTLVYKRQLTRSRSSDVQSDSYASIE